jgi:protein import protein ZIM17
VVLLDCPGCGMRHLVADRKGWFGAPGSVEDFLAGKGEEVRSRSGGGEGGVLEVSEEELVGWTPKEPRKPAGA